MALPMIIVYVIAIPLLAALYIHKNHHEPEMHLFFLTSGFNDEKPDYAWFYVVQLKTTLITLITTIAISCSALPHWRKQYGSRLNCTS